MKLKSEIWILLTNTNNVSSIHSLTANTDYEEYNNEVIKQIRKEAINYVLDNNLEDHEQVKSIIFINKEQYEDLLNNRRR